MRGASASRDTAAQALKLFPWICGRCAREFAQADVHELTVHHEPDHDHDPPDGTATGNCCLYCHDNEHQRYVDQGGSALREEDRAGATHSPFADLASLLGKGE